MRLEGKVALISGGARGMGAVEARLFTKEGACVVVGDILEEEGQRLVREIAASGGRVFFTLLDVTSEEDWRRGVELAVEKFGKLNVLVNNAGIIQRIGVEETSGQTWDKIMEVNAKGVFLGTKVAVPEMRRTGGGSIVNISSLVGIVGYGQGPAYSASKGAVRLFTKSAALQYAKDGIRINSVHPGPINTEMTAETRADPEAFRSRLGTIPMGRYGEPEEIANGVLFLASDESSYMTGSELVIDGGHSAQ